MNAEWILESMALPPRALVNHRVPKKLINEKGARSAADRRLINEGIERVDWRASLKPSTVGIAAAQGNGNDAEEIAILTVRCRGDGRTQRLGEILHRSVPYPLVTLVDTGDGVIMSLAAKRSSKAGADQSVIEGDIVEAAIGDEMDAGTVADLGNELAIDARRHRDLRDLYDYWMDVVVAVRAMQISGELTIPQSHEDGLDRWETLRSYERLTADIETIRRRADKETQMARKVELNLELRALRQEQEAILERI